MLKAERFAWGVGIIALVVWIAGAGAGRFGTARALDRFDVLRAAAQLSSEEHPDQSLWSPERVKAWEEARKRNSPDPLGVLHIPRLKVVAPVLPGTDDWTLNRGVGHIDDTALPGSTGNIGIAAHRDSYFRALKDIVNGDVITIETVRGADTYRVERIWIVDPEDVSVIDPTEAPSVTLVTCYPFYFIGPAPRRFIVRAVRVPVSGG
jgi:sortase A